MSVSIFSLSSLLFPPQVVPPTSLEFHYILSQSLEKVTLRVPRLELNLSDELRQIFEQFHLAIFKPVSNEYL